MNHKNTIEDTSRDYTAISENWTELINDKNCSLEQRGTKAASGSIMIVELIVFHFYAQ
ncbi:hypothetical protein [Legionella saoudiensis]|uniref:hypothetical protein n=1 Tax=Legionella saoudiensis TaxID=1750561 RepID=UPI0012D74E0C|nr:hypothetical protein [Legionella saoudiensis]